MKTPRLLLLVSIWAAWVTTAGAKDEADSAWVIRTFRLDLGPPPASPWDPFASVDSPSSRPEGAPPASGPQAAAPPHPFPALPDAAASSKVWEEQLLKSTAAVSEICDTLQVPSPPGMVALYEPRSCTLVVRTTKEHLKLLTPALEPRIGNLPRDLVFTMEVVEADASVIRSLVEEAFGHQDHTPAWKRCTELLGAGKAKSLGQFRLNTCSGQRVATRSGREITPVKELQVDSSGRVAAVHDESHSAVGFEIDPVLGPDLRTLDVTFHFHFDYAPPLERIEKVAGLVGSSAIEVPVLESQGANLSANLSLPVGASKLIGIWRPRGKPEYDRGDLMHAAFLRAEAPLTLVRPPDNLAVLLQKHAAPPPASAARKHAEEALGAQDPNALISKAIRIHPTFFAAAAVGDRDPMERICNVQTILEMQGIPFPEGTSASFNAMAGTINVRNTAKSIALIESFVDDARLLPSPMISCTAYIIESDSAIVRQLAEETRNTSDHSNLWERVKKLSGSYPFRIVEVIRGEGRSGDRASFESGINRFSIGEVLLHGPENPEDETGDVDEKSQGENVPIQGTSTQASTTLKSVPVTAIPVESRIVGTSMEWDPVIAEGGRLVRMNFALDHHFAPPTSRQGISSPGAIMPAGIPNTQFHFAHIVSSILFVPGTTRLMGTWKTEDSPGHEGRDISQAVFLRVDLIPFEPPVSEEGL